MKDQTDKLNIPPEEHPYNLQRAMARFERGYISNILELAGWNLGKSAQMLGIDQEVLSLKIRKYRLLEE